MRRPGTLAAAGPAVAVFLLAASAAAGPLCTVADPTGTPLNLRAAPNGAIIGTIGNGAVVELARIEHHKGKAWALLARGPAGPGFVFAAYLDCPPAAPPLKSSPLKPRAAP
ncbi:SH3 domain-containing protein [Ensifer soli]|uniref:peptide-binding protein n=1 Tax=Ciceribacter sp. sgz301302 TaxID=3342379 RepID=UPI0035B7957C